MKKVMGIHLIPTLLVLAGLFLASCAGQNNAQRNANLRTLNTNGTVNGQFVQNYCPQGYSNFGAIYDSGYTNLGGGTFEDRVKALLSVTVDPAEIGYISGNANDQTGVRFQGSVKLDANGNVDVAQSTLLIKVYDSYVLQSSSDGSNQYQPIPIEFTQAQSGNFNPQTGAGYVLFKDQYGEIRFDGQLNAQNFSGTVSYRNYSRFDGGSPYSGDLGQFTVARCAFIK